MSETTSTAGQVWHNTQGNSIFCLFHYNEAVDFDNIHHFMSLILMRTPLGV